ncbi:MAG: TIGR00730 family Rossman fold protein [Nitrospirota bacterium]|nr:TIGR00730 family Rossman fold protein [Nitrospirota bacterium]
MKLYFTQDNGHVDEVIKGLMDMVDGIRRPEIVRDMILAALKAGQEDDERADLKLMNTSLKEMRFTAKVFGPYRKFRKVTVFGSARVKPEDTVYGMARRFGEKLVEAGYYVITGAGGGIMEAAAKGAGAEHSFGVNIRLPFEQVPNPVFKKNPRLITYKYFFNRKVAFLKEASAVVLFPGGFGTLDETMEAITLIQTGKHNPIPLILIDEPGGTYWPSWVEFFRKELLTRNYINPMDFSIFECVESVDSAVEKINHFYRRYHSQRYVNKKLVIRLSSTLEPGQVDELHTSFLDIIDPGGKIYLTDALPEETDEPEIAGLPRLVIDFNRKSFGRLCRLISAINDF